LAFLDQALGARARDVGVRLGVGVHQLDVDAQHLLEHRRREVRALLAGLADERLHAGARQEHADFEFRGLGAHDAERRERGERARRGEGLVELATIGALRHGFPSSWVGLL